MEIVYDETLIRMAVQSASELGEAQYLRQETVDVIVSQVMKTLKIMNSGALKASLKMSEGDVLYRQEN